MGLVILTETTHIFLEVLKVVNNIIMTALGIFYINQIYYLIMSIFLPKKKYPEAKKDHSYGIIIAARNEESVIGDLIDSIYKQNYSKDLMHIFVVADNCADQTANIAKDRGAIVFERFNEAKLTLDDIITYNIAFKDINLSNYSNMDYHYKKLW